jgi:Derlin-2/3
LFVCLQVQYSRLLEEGDFRGRTANYVLMLLFGIGNISLVAAYTKKLFLGHALTFMMTYVWGRRNEDVKMVFLGFIQFNAPYLPWVMLTFGVLIGKSDGIAMDLIGITVGHLYYFLEYVYPTIAEIRSWPIKHILVPPILLHWICGTFDAYTEDNELTAAIEAIAEQERREERQRLLRQN